MANRIIESALQLLFPRKCPVCGEILADEEKVRHNPFICKYCYEKLEFYDDRAAEKDSLHEVYGFSLLRHDEYAKKILYGLKYSNRQENADFIGKEIAVRFGRQILKIAPDVFIPVPLHKRRQRERGFNQAEIIAKNISGNILDIYGTFLPVDNEYLIRNKKTLPQKELDRSQREENVRGKFEVTGYVKYKKAALVDDIITTSSTLNECVRTLRLAGVEEIFYITASAVEFDSI